MRLNNLAGALKVTLGFALLLGSAATVTAQVKRVQMHIEGYLCGN